MWTVQSWSNFDDDGARPVPYLQLVSPVVEKVASGKRACHPKSKRKGSY